MIEEYEKILARGLKNKDLNKKFLTVLAKKKIPRFDLLVQKLHAEVFESIDCTQCANCCKTLGPRFTTTDIGRISSLLKMRETVFIREYLIVDEDSDFVFKSMPCPFLVNDDLCGIFDKRPRACAQYPHTDEKNIRIGQMSLNMQYCPAVVLIVEKLKEQFGKLG